MDPLRAVCERFLAAPCAPGTFCSSVHAPAVRRVEVLRQDPAFVALAAIAASDHAPGSLADPTRTLSQDVVSAVADEYLDGLGTLTNGDDDAAARAERHLWRLLCAAARTARSLQDRALPALPLEIEADVHLGYRLRRIGYALAAGSPTDCLALLSVAERGGAPAFVTASAQLPLLVREAREQALRVHLEELVEGLFLDRYRVEDAVTTETDWLPVLLADVVEALGPVAVASAAAQAVEARDADERAILHLLAGSLPSTTAVADGSHVQVWTIADARRRDGLSTRTSDLVRSLLLAGVPSQRLVAHVRAVHAFAMASAADYFGELHGLWAHHGGAADRIGM